MEDRTIIILALILAITFLLAIISCKIIQYLKNKQECNLKKYQQYIFMLENSFPAEKNIEEKCQKIDKKIEEIDNKISKSGENKKKDVVKVENKNPETPIKS